MESALQPQNDQTPQEKEQADVLPSTAIKNSADGFMAQNDKKRLIIILLGVLLLVQLGLAFYWGLEPSPFDIKEATVRHTGSQKAAAITGAATTSALLETSRIMLEKPGGYLSNDRTPPSFFMDNIPSWEFGVLVQVRDLAQTLRNDISRSQSQSLEDEDLAKAEPKFNYDNNSWMFPSTEEGT